MTHRSVDSGNQVQSPAPFHLFLNTKRVVIRGYCRGMVRIIWLSDTNRMILLVMAERVSPTDSGEVHPQGLFVMISSAAEGGEAAIGDAMNCDPGYSPTLPLARNKSVLSDV